MDMRRHFALMPGAAPLELYGAQTGNCIRAAIALEEMGLSYAPKFVDLSSGPHQGTDRLALNPLGKVPCPR